MHIYIVVAASKLKCTVDIATSGILKNDDNYEETHR